METKKKRIPWGKTPQIVSDVSASAVEELISDTTNTCISVLQVRRVIERKTGVYAFEYTHIIRREMDELAKAGKLRFYKEGIYDVIRR